MKKWLLEHPYFSTSAVFLIIIVLGWRFLYWEWDHFAFMLLLYFIVTLGIRLDDISRKIGSLSDRSTRTSAEGDNILHQLNDIKAALRDVNFTLNKVLEQFERKNTNKFLEK